MIKPMKVFEIIQNDPGVAFDVVQRYETIDILWGLDHIKLTDDDIKVLKEGKCLFTDNGEYSQLISYEPKASDIGDYHDIQLKIN